jgi:hypothetical protein
VLLLAEDHSAYVASILSRRARLPGLMWDLDNTPLTGTTAHPPCSAGRAWVPSAPRTPRPPQAPHRRGGSGLRGGSRQLGKRSPIRCLRGVSGACDVLSGSLRFRRAAGEDLPVLRLSRLAWASRLPGRCHCVPVLAGTLRHRPGRARRANGAIRDKTASPRDAPQTQAVSERSLGGLKTPLRPDHQR